MVELSHLGWLGNVWKRPIENLVRILDQLKGSSIVKERGRSRKIISEIIKKDLDANRLSIDIIYDRSFV